MKFRKRPLVIEAQQFLEGEPIPKGVCFGWRCNSGCHDPHLHTIHDDQRIDLKFGDWVVSEPDGVHFYPCKPDIFEMIYESVPATELPIKTSPSCCGSYRPCP